MRKAKQTAIGSEVYALLRTARLNESERQIAFNALRKAEAIADAIAWVKEKATAVSDYLLRPSLKH